MTSVFGATRAGLSQDVWARSLDLYPRAAPVRQMPEACILARSKLARLGPGACVPAGGTMSGVGAVGPDVADVIIDEALTAMEGKAAIYAAHGYPDLGNHGPMVAEALVTLGHPEAVMPWVEAVVAETPEAPRPQRAITDWRSALGDGGRYGDWQQLFRNELAEHPWRAVVADWVGRLVPGMASAGAHGVIRVAHALRSLTACPTEARLGELADGLATWAAYYYEMPRPVTRGDRRPHPPAVDQVPVAPAGDGTTGMRLVAVEALGSFQALEAPYLGDADLDCFLSDVMAAFAGTFAQNTALTSASATGLVHSVTVPAAVRLVLPYLHDDARREACVRAWQTAAAIHAGYGMHSRVASAAPPSAELDDLVDRAVTLGHAHAVKFVEACGRAYRTDGNDVFLLAAARAVEVYEASPSRPPRKRSR